MQIADWLVKNKMSLKQLAELAKIPVSTFYAAYSYNREMSLKFGKAICKATKGQVTVDEVINADRKPFRDDRKQLKKKQITCPHCKAEFKAPRGWVKK